MTLDDVVMLYRWHGESIYNNNVKPWDVSELRGKNLACWCPLDQPCHADVLLEWANKS